jgi:hypothetical protein
MKYVCLIYLQEEALNAMPKTEFDARVAECLAYSEEIRKSGQYVTSEALQPAHTATTVRVRNGKLSATDRPLRRDEGAARRLLPHRCQGPQ